MEFFGIFYFIGNYFYPLNFLNIFNFHKTVEILIFLKIIQKMHKQIREQFGLYNIIIQMALIKIIHFLIFLFQNSIFLEKLIILPFLFNSNGQIEQKLIIDRYLSESIRLKYFLLILVQSVFSFNSILSAQLNIALIRQFVSKNLHHNRIRNIF